MIDRLRQFAIVAAGSLLLAFTPAQTHAQDPGAVMDISEVVGAAGYPVGVPMHITFGGTEDIGAYSFTVCFDPAVVDGVDVLTKPDGIQLPFFGFLDLLPGGIEYAALVDHDLPTLYPGTTHFCSLVLQCEAVTAPASTIVEGCTIGSAAVQPAVVTVQEIGYPATVEPGAVEVVLEAFRRGECNGDGTVNIADAITMFGQIVPTTVVPPITCQDSCDANDDGALDIADVVTILAYLFQGGEIPAPLLECGADPSPDPLDCVDPGSC